LRPFQPVGVGSGQNWACRLERRGMMQFVSNYGVWLVAAFVALESVGFPVPAEAALIAAAVFIARTHDSSIWFLVTAASLAAIFGEIVGFWIGRKFGPRLLTRYGGHLGLTERRVRIGHWLFVRYGGRFVFIARFLPFLRNMAALLAGTNSMAQRGLYFARGTAASGWVMCCGLGGFALRTAFSRLTLPGP